MRRLQLESEILRRFAPQNDSFCDVFKEDILSATRRKDLTHIPAENTEDIFMTWLR
jgi:hypothetical protein